MSVTAPLPDVLADAFGDAGPASLAARRAPATRLALALLRRPWNAGWARSRSLGFWCLTNFAVMLAYLALGWAVGRFFASFGLFPAPIWLPAGLAAAAAMLGGLRCVPGIFLGSFLVNAMVYGAGPELAAMISVGNALGPLAGALLTRRFRPPTGLFTRFRGVVAFLAGLVLLHAAITASIGTLALWWLGGVPADSLAGHWSAWLLCDAGGTFYFAPSLILWMRLERTPGGAARLALLDGAVWIGTALLAAAVFSLRLPPGLPSAQLVFLLAVPLSWIALRISLRAAYTLLTLLCVIASAGTVAGYGPFQSGGVANPMQSVGMLIVLCAMNILTLLALVSERREAEAALAEGNRLLEWRIAERTEELRRQAETDALTGLANRRSFLVGAAAAMAAESAAGRPFTLLAFDLDHFKAVNDSAGHAAGDAVLRLAAERCRGALRHGDLLGRIGGEEFAIALPGAGAAEALALAERLRQAMAGIALPRSAAPEGRLTASFGIAEAAPGETQLDPLLRRADLALYSAKHGGRDRITLSPPAATLPEGWINSARG
ncbi:diguanylate cyclase [Pseudoroseomonas cervicalis]|uniref:GGDEF domain-containing protein n=1 Tax=Teichococcus cervicalis TaxID=204525 RepID=UPI00278AACBD|nr:diguanylate cyclase [Pseudoroseomonas cervicalis]MDQ1079929.1 diguanylate cyclase (GGDEF)-like protein [Pseudoroseomonas cervicalis]